MIRRRNLRTRSIKMLVLDEADEMLNKGKTLIFPELLPCSVIYYRFQGADLRRVPLPATRNSSRSAFGHFAA